MKTYVEIGACDFDNLDGYLDDGRVIFVEPVPVYMESLKKKNGHHINAVYEPSAISSYDGDVSITYVEPSTAKEQWVRGISHLDFSSSNLINRNLSIGYDIGKVVTTVVPCLKLDTLIKKHLIDSIEYLKIDVEGHELEILKNYSWVIKPKRLKIEHKFLRLIELVRLLADKGYATIDEVDDVYAILK